MNSFKLSNDIFKLGLTAAELSVYAYMCSIHSRIRNLDENNIIHVKQSTIAENCGIKAVQTVKGIINRLSDKGLVDVLERSVKANRHKGTYFYVVKRLSLENGYFYVERSTFGKLNPRQMMIYLFICKSFDRSRNICWNSYNDITAQTGMKRETIIETIDELVSMKFIVKMKRKSKINRKVYVDNHYQLILYIRGTITKKKKRLYPQYNRKKVSSKKRTQPLHIKNSTLFKKCQVFSENYCLSRGSPQIYSH